MEGIAKTAQGGVQIITQETTTPKFANVMEGVHLEIYRFFNINPVTDGGNQQLKDINDWAFRNEGKLHKAIRKIRNLEIKLGQPSSGETRLSKLHNWIRMTDMASGLTKKRDEEINKIRARYNNQLNDIRTTHKDRLKKINAELAHIKQEYRRSSSIIRNRPLREIEDKKREYNRQINELKSMRNVYGGK